MFLSDRTMRLLMEMDAPTEAKVALLNSMRADEEAAAATQRRRAVDRDRQARHRERTTADVTPEDVTKRDNADNAVTKREEADVAPRTYAQVVNPISSSLRSEEVGGGDGGETRERAQKPADDWPKGNGPHLAKLLVEAAASPHLDLNRSPDLHTTVGRLIAWKREGASWEHDVLPVVTGVCAKQRSRISTWKFFDAAIARSIAENRAALEIPEARVAPRGQGPPGMVAQIAADHAEARRRALES
ncbi:hypothetical protein [Phenylobacterium sp. J367]|uniref:hypothetical protein n=1 Tax=Phenylobacterium sp. J367 TaxID=2898435 RepID=UPI0021517682|nr:hypothetical protein [Phenylobacterium sp. J367]MCR5876949.1 hypothetical protein [Phenylobacterium sp. J367]MCR5877017.1 hypothetical protein [Phenylobacterium sp. J367]